MSSQEQKIAMFRNFVNSDAENWKNYAYGPAERQSPLVTLTHVANTTRNLEKGFPNRTDQVDLTRNLYNKYDKMANRGGSSRKMRSYRNKSNKRNKRSKLTRRTRRGKRRLH
jgi:hypothetical protein